MYISPLNYGVQLNRVSFKASDCVALPPNTTFLNDKKTFGFSDKYKEIKKYNPVKSSIITLMRLNASDYDTMLHAIYKSAKRANALINKKSQLAVSKARDTYNGITDDKLGLTFSNGYGFYNIVKCSNEKGNLYTKREKSYADGAQITEFSDKSRFNEKYNIENKYLETTKSARPGEITRAREIEVKDSDLTPILMYSYSKKDFSGSERSKFNVNGKIYDAKISKDAKAVIISGQKISKMDFSPKIANMPKEQQQIFVNALKMLPPQIILSLDEYFDNIYSYNNHFDTSLYSPEITAKSILDSTVEFLSKRHLLFNNPKLIKTFESEKENFMDWLMYESDGHLRKGMNSYIKNNSAEKPEDEIIEVIKSVSNMLWLEEYDESSANDEGARLLLSFFPETVAFIVSAFELNNIVNSLTENKQTENNK